MKEYYDSKKDLEGELEFIKTGEYTRIDDECNRKREEVDYIIRTVLKYEDKFLQIVKERGLKSEARNLYDLAKESISEGLVRGWEKEEKKKTVFIGIK